MKVFPAGIWPLILNSEEILCECRPHSIIIEIGYSHLLLTIIGYLPDIRVSLIEFLDINSR